jgi:hypothetical protein
LKKKIVNFYEKASKKELIINIFKKNLDKKIMLKRIINEKKRKCIFDKLLSGVK